MYTAHGTLKKTDYVQEYAPLVKRIAHHMMSRLPASVTGMTRITAPVACAASCQGTMLE